MASYIAMIRGINVGGKNSLKMAGLRAALEEVGLSEVQTYVQSGNVVFESKSKSCSKLSSTIHDLIFDEFCIDVSVVVKTPAEFKKALSKNPFCKKPYDPTLSHVTFLDKKPSLKARGEVENISSGKDEIAFSDNLVFIYCPNGYGRTKLTNNVLEKKLNMGATTRNWKTVNALFEMSQN